MPVAGKTGTTEGYNDLWFVGYTPYYTCAVWSGFDNNEKLPDYARNYHKNLWRKVMSRIHEGMEYKEFDTPSSVEMTSICADTGLLPRAGCPVITEYFDIGDLPTDYCDQHFYEVEEETYEENPELTPTPQITIYPTVTPDPNGDGSGDYPDNGDSDGDGYPDDNGDGGDGDGDGGYPDDNGDGGDNGMWEEEYGEY